jgi:cytochrome c1
MRITTPVRLVGAAAVAGIVAGCGSSAGFISVQGGHAHDAPQLIQAFGCGACHTIGGVSGADGQVGPALTHFARRRYIAGALPNTPDNLIRWIEHPQEVEPGTVMPDLNVGDAQARDIAAYLYRH